MEKTNFLTSACRYCRYYKPEGRRGGYCQLLSVAVQSNWKACAVAASPFSHPVINLEDIFHLESSFLEPSIPPKISLNSNLKQQSKAS